MAATSAAMPFDFSLVGQTSEPESFTYTWKDTALYALGVGATRAQLDYLYEGRGPKVLPSFAVVPTFLPMFRLLSRSGGDLAMVVHGAQSVRMHRPLAANATLQSTATLRGIYDMRRFASVVIDTATVDTEHGDKICDCVWTMIFRDAGGFGGEPPPKSDAPKAPKGAEPSFRIEEATSPQQALLYRLSGDLNPLHADPEFAQRVGFAQGPILHGLCTYGYMLRHLTLGLLEGNGDRVRAFEAQFRRPVWPGDSLVTEGFALEDGKVALSVSVKERSEAVLAGAWAEIEC